MRWLRKDGVIIGCEMDGIEYNLIAIVQNETLHNLYHKELKEEQNGKFNECVQLGDGE